MNIKSNLRTTKVISPLDFEMIFTIFLLVMFVRKEADAQESVGIPSNPGRSLSTRESLVSKADVRRNLRSVFDKLMQKTGVNKMEDFIKVEVSIFYLLRILNNSVALCKSPCYRSNINIYFSNGWENLVREALFF